MVIIDAELKKQLAEISFRSRVFRNCDLEKFWDRCAWKAAGNCKTNVEEYLAFPTGK